jgi:hypothetical protein
MWLFLHVPGDYSSLWDMLPFCNVDTGEICCHLMISVLLLEFEDVWTCA